MAQIIPGTYAAYYAACAADDEWHAAIIATYGKREAANARYDERGTATPELRQLHDVKHRAMGAYRSLAWPHASQVAA